MAFFAIDGLRIKGHDVTVAFDRSGARYGLGAGLQTLHIIDHLARVKEPVKHPCLLQGTHCWVPLSTQDCLHVWAEANLLMAC